MFSRRMQPNKYECVPDHQSTTGPRQTLGSLLFRMRIEQFLFRCQISVFGAKTSYSQVTANQRPHPVCSGLSKKSLDRQLLVVSGGRPWFRKPGTHSILNKSLLNTLLTCFPIPTPVTFVTAGAILGLQLLLSTRYCTEPISNTWSIEIARRSLEPGLRRLSPYGLPLWGIGGMSGRGGGRIRS